MVRATKFHNVPDWAVNCKARKVGLDKGWTWDTETDENLSKFLRKYCRSQYCEEDDWEPLPFQEEILKSLLCWRDERGKRGITTGCVHMARGNGKTYLAACLVLWQLLYPEYSAANIFSASVNAKSARQIWLEVRHFVTNSYNAEVFRPFKVEITKAAGQESIKIGATNASYYAVSSEGRTSLGHNLSTAILDETSFLDEENGSLLWAALTTGQLKRKRGVLRLSISTASFNLNGFYHTELYSKAKRQLASDDENPDPRFYGYVAECPLELIHEPRGWRMANPGMGTAEREGIFSEETFREQHYEPAKDNPVSWTHFQVLNLNRFAQSRSGDWFAIDKYDEAEETIPDEDLVDCPCVVGIDGSEAVDPTSVTAVFVLGDGRYYAKSWGWACEGGARRRDRGNLPSYYSFKKDRNDKEDTEENFWVQDGDTIELEQVKDFLVELASKYAVVEYVFDGYGMKYIGEFLDANGFEVSRMAQTAKDFTAPIREFVRLVSEGKLIHPKNRWQRYCLCNAIVKIDANKELKFDKRNAVDKTDAAISLVMALGRAVSLEVETVERATSYDTEVVFW